MPGKYSKFRGKLEPFALEALYQEKVDTAKKGYAAFSPTELARQLKIEGDKKEDLELVIGHLNVEIEAVSQLLVSALESADVQKIVLDSGMSCSIEVKPYVSVIETPEARAAYSRWASSAPIKKLWTLNTQTRNALVTEQLLSSFSAGKPLAKPLAAWVKVFLKSRARLYGKKNEESNGGDEDE